MEIKFQYIADGPAQFLMPCYRFSSILRLKIQLALRLDVATFQVHLYDGDHRLLDHHLVNRLALWRHRYRGYVEIRVLPLAIPRSLPTIEFNYRYGFSGVDDDLTVVTCG